MAATLPVYKYDLGTVGAALGNTEATIVVRVAESIKASSVVVPANLLTFHEHQITWSLL